MELIHLRMSDIQFKADHMSVFIEQCKTDVYREGNRCIIAWTGNDTCPVNMLQRYIDMADLTIDSDVLLFRTNTFYKKCKTYKNCVVRCHCLTHVSKN